MCFDTTPSNTGRHSGACVHLESRLEKDLLHIACRHHILELAFGAALTTLMGPTSAAEVPLLKRFKQQWNSIDHTSVSSRVNNDVEPFLKKQKNITDLLRDITYNQQVTPRVDYGELVQLWLIFLGDISCGGMSILECH